MKWRKNSLSSHRKALQYRGEQCLNCGHPLDRSDIYCPHCSQLNSTKHLSAKDYFAEFLSSILVYDSRLRNTLKDLLFRPGVISQNYVRGQRLKYANPFRFYLSVSIIYFLLQGFLSFLGTSEEEPINMEFSPSNQSSSATLVEGLSKDVFVSQSDSLEAVKRGLPMYFSEERLQSMSFFKGLSNRASLYFAYQAKNKEQTATQALKSLQHPVNLKNKWLYTRAAALQHILDRPQDFKDYISGKIPFFFFFFAPFFALFFWLLYSKGRHSYMEHLIFIFHIFSFVFLVLLLLLLPDYLMGNSILVSIFFGIIGPVYFYLALKRFYGQGTFMTMIKFVIFSFLFGISFFVAMGLFVAASLAIY